MRKIKMFFKNLLIKAFKLDDIKTKLLETEQKLKTLRLAVDQNPASILITNTSGTIVYVNSKFTRISGYTSDEVIGKKPGILKSGATSDEEYQHLWNNIKSGKEWNGFFQNKKKNGELYFEHAHILPILDENGEISNFLGIKEDVTNEIQSKKQIRTLSKAIEQSPIAIIITNATGKIEFVNNKFTSFMQYTLEEVKGKNPRIFNPGHLPEDTLKNIWDNLRSKKMWQGEFHNRKKDGTFFWGNVIIAPLLDEHAIVTNYIISMEDITEKKKMICELIDAKNKAQESDLLKTAFLQNMSHEIRTPMNAIVGFSRLLNTEFDNKEKLKKYTSIIEQQSTNLLEIINEILDIARIEAGQLLINLERFNIYDLFNDLHEFFNEYRKRIDKENIIFNLYCSPLIKTIFTDQVKLKQVLINLISNALKFTNTGTIELKCDPKGEETLFSVSDTGIGVPENKKTEIFERFKKAHIESSQIYSGTGLGLSIVKGILDLLGGRIWVESEPRKGSTFFFTIPNTLNCEQNKSLNQGYDHCLAC